MLPVPPSSSSNNHQVRDAAGYLQTGKLTDNSTVCSVNRVYPTGNSEQPPSTLVYMVLMEYRLGSLLRLACLFSRWTEIARISLIQEKSARYKGHWRGQENKRGCFAQDTAA